MGDDTLRDVPDLPPAPDADELARALDRGEQRRLEQRILSDGLLADAASRQTAPALGAPVTKPGLGPVADPGSGLQAPGEPAGKTVGGRTERGLPQAAASPPDPDVPPATWVPGSLSSKQRPASDHLAADTIVDALEPPDRPLEPATTGPIKWSWVAIAAACVAAPLLLWLFLSAREAPQAPTSPQAGLGGPGASPAATGAQATASEPGSLRSSGEQVDTVAPSQTAAPPPSSPVSASATQDLAPPKTARPRHSSDIAPGGEKPFFEKQP